MAQSAVKRNALQFNRGFNSDSGPLTFPEDSSLDEQNYDIEIDGTRRRRRGLEQDTGEITVAVPFDEDRRVRSFKWAAAGDLATINFTVMQLGRDVRFFEDPADGTVGAEKSFRIDLTGYMTSGSTAAQVDGQLLDMTTSRGKLAIVGEYISPLVVAYDPDIDNITVMTVDIRERDLYGVDDGTPHSTQPVTLSLEHQYNLVNQGWRQVDITQYFTDTGVYPARNQVYARGFRRQTVVGIADIDGTKAFSSDKLIAELFQDAPAAHGHFLIDPFNTTFGATGSADSLALTTLGITPIVGDTFTLTISTSTPHGLLVTDTFGFLGPLTVSYTSTVDGSIKWYTIIGFPYTVGGVVDPDTFTTTVLSGLPADFGFPVQLITQPGLLAADSIYTHNLGYTTNLRPSTCAFMAGRIFYGGINFGKLTTKIYFSQVIETEAQYGKCYQVADPTDENISDLISTDGGTINIPEMGICYRLIPYENGILAFGFNGVWFIGPGVNGYFQADSYSVRKVSEIGVDGAASIVLAETFPFYWGRNSIYRIARDDNQGFLTAVNLSIKRIDNFFNGITNRAKQLVQVTYDALLKKIYWLYQSSVGTDVTEGFDRILMYDLKYDAFVKLAIPRRSLTVTLDGVVYRAMRCASLFSCKTPNPNRPSATVKFVYQNDDDTLFEVMDADEVRDFSDFGGPTESEAYMITGFDTAQSPANRKQALFITVYSLKTETGYTAVGDDLVPIAESSTLMQTRWDWANHAASGKWSNEQEVYRHARLYTPVDAFDNFDNGEYLVVTRNKIRGRGRALNIKFTAGNGKHSHIAGWTTNYRVLTQE